MKFSVPVYSVVLATGLGLCCPGLAGELAYRAPGGVAVAPEPTVRTGVARPDPGALQLAEQQYQAGQYESALHGFGMIAAMQGHPFAWLRVGNVWHRRGNASMAANAYQRARQAASLSPRHSKLRYRAIMNLALLGLEQASQALDEVGPVDTSSISPVWLSEVRTRLHELQARLPAGVKPTTHSTTTARPTPAHSALTVRAIAPE